MDNSTKRKIKVFLNKPFLLAGPVRKLRFWGEGSCTVLGFLLWLGREKGVRNEELQHAHPGVCSIPVCCGQRGTAMVLEPSRRILWVTS